MRTLPNYVDIFAVSQTSLVDSALVSSSEAVHLRSRRHATQQKAIMQAVHQCRPNPSSRSCLPYVPLSATRTPTRHAPIMPSQLTHGCTSSKSLPASFPAPLISSPSPPGWNGRYGRILYIRPLYELHADLPLRPFMIASCDGVIRCSAGTPERAVGGDVLMRCAQSRGE